MTLYGRTIFIDARGLADCEANHKAVQTKLDFIIKNMATANERLSSIESQLTEASAEILAEIAALKTSETLSAEGLATLERIEAKATALASISPAV